MKELGASDVVGGQSLRRHQRGGGVLAQVVELVAGRAVRHEADAGRSRGMAGDTRSVDAFRFPEVEKGIAHPVLADTGQVSRGGTLARRRDRHVLRIAAEAL